MPEQQPTTATLPLAPGGAIHLQGSSPVPSSGKAGCVYTLIVVVITVVSTLAVEVILGIFLAGYAARTVWKNIQNGLTPLSAPPGLGNTSVAQSSGGMLKLTPDQKKLIESFGIKPEDIPASVPIDKITCVQNALGNDRVQQIMKGQATPGITDLIRARSCFIN